MGTVVHFHARHEDATAKSEAILSRLGEFHRQRAVAKEALPAVLAGLIEAGETEVVLRAVSLWGSGLVEPHEVLAMVEQYGAVSGIKSVGNRPF